jgi:hypothetical protein
LVHQLNHPTGAIKDNIKAIQEKLQQIQKSPQGWDVARYLLDHPNSSTKFFGALTFIVKINQSWCVDAVLLNLWVRLTVLYRSDLSTDAIQQLKNYLIGSYVSLVESQEKQLVTRKLSAALIAIFFKDESWTHPIQDIATFFWQHGRQTSSDIDYEGKVVPALNGAQISGLLSFSQTMAEDSVKSCGLLRITSVISRPLELQAILTMF